MMSMVLAVGLAACQSSQDADKAVVLPVRVAEGADRNVKELASAVERNLTDALMRHAPFKVLSRSEVAAMVGQAGQQQLMGCDAESCLTEIAEALNADFLVSSQLDVADGLWTLQSSLIERKSAAAKRRHGIRARDPVGVLSSVDILARQLAGKPVIRLDDPQLAERLQTDQEGVKALVEGAGKKSDVDLANVWTEVITRHNRDKAILSVVEGGLLAASGLVTLLGAGPAIGFGVTARSMTPQLVDFNTDANGKIDMKRKYVFPYGLFVLTSVAPIPPLLLAAALLSAAGVVGVVDALDFGRIKVGKDGCCRDEKAIREASIPGVMERLGALLAAGGAAQALAVPLVMAAMILVTTYFLFIPNTILAALITSEQLGPYVMADGVEWEIGRLAFDTAYVIPIVSTVLVGIGAGVGAILLFVNQRSNLVDRE